MYIKCCCLFYRTWIELWDNTVYSRCYSSNSSIRATLWEVCSSSSSRVDLTRSNKPTWTIYSSRLVSSNAVCRSLCGAVVYHVTLSWTLKLVQMWHGKLLRKACKWVSTAPNKGLACRFRVPISVHCMCLYSNHLRLFLIVPGVQLVSSGFIPCLWLSKLKLCFQTSFGMNMWTRTSDSLMMIADQIWSPTLLSRWCKVVWCSARAVSQLEFRIHFVST